MKIMDKSLITHEEDLNRLHREISILQTIKHPFIIEMYEIYDSDTQMSIVSEYAGKGELFDHIVDSGRLSEEQSCFYFYQIVQALEYLHNLKICHRDLKPENILLSKGGHIKLIDFGLSNICFDSKNPWLQTSCGSPCYAPPEMIKKDKYCGFTADLWSLGVTLYAMVTGTIILLERLCSFRGCRGLKAIRKDSRRQVLHASDLES